MFNNYDGTDSSTGALYQISAYPPFSIISKVESGAYKSISACTFYKVDSFLEHGPVDTLCYIKAQNLLFVEIPVTGGAPTSLTYYGSMVLDINTTIYDLTMYDQNVYKLYGSYYYSLESLNQLVTSIALTAAPAIVPANVSGFFNKSLITAAVKDQFFQPIIGRTVTFTENDTSTSPGYMDIGSDSSDALGLATDYYYTGNQAKSITITATVQQT